MNKPGPVHFDANTTLSEQAAHWWVVLNGEDCTQADHRDFAAWVAQSPERVEAYLRSISAMNALRNPGTPWPETPVDELVREAQTARNIQGLPARVARVASPHRQRLLVPWAAGLAAAALLALGVVLLGDSSQHYRTGTGEQLSVRLGDGSLMTLNAASSVEVNFDSAHRAVELMSGEALFQVAHEPTRPFDVTAGRAHIRAVGTEFNVNRRHANTTVTVLEGRVIVSAKNGGGGVPGASPTNPNPVPPSALEARDRLVMEDSGPVSIGRVRDLDTVKAWTERRLVFENLPLGDVAEEFNRFNRRKIRIEDAQLLQQEVTGVFQADDPASFLAFIAQVPGVAIHEAGGVSTVRVKKVAPDGGPD